MAQEQLTDVTATPSVAVTEQAKGQGQVQEPAGASQAEQGRAVAVEEERRMRQRAEKENEILRRKLEVLEHAQPAAQEFDPEELAQYKHVDAIVDKKLSGVKEDNRKTQQLLFAQSFSAQHPDFTEVFNLGIEIVENSPGMVDTIVGRVNAAELVYKLGMTHPSFQAKSQQRVTQEVADQINKNLNSQKTLSDVGGGGSPPIEKDWRQASHEDIEKKKEELRRKSY